MRFQKIYLP